MVRNLRWIIFLPAAVLAFASPVSAETFTENFDDDTYDLSVQLGGNAFWCAQYSDQYGTSGPSLCLFDTSSDTEFRFPEDVQVQGFEFSAGAKNGTVDLTVLLADGSTFTHPIDGSCCEVTVRVESEEPIVGFVIPADGDLWLFDSLSWWGETTPATTTTTEASLPELSTTVEPTTTTGSSTTSSVVPALPPPPPDTQTPVETTVPETSTVPSETTIVPSTVAIATTAPNQSTSTTSSTSTLPVESTAPPPSSSLPPDASGASESDANPDPVVDTGVVQQPPSDASLEQKLDFESKVDLFSGEYDNYVPIGSTITVAQRRTIVAATAVLIMFSPPPTRIRRR